MLLLSGSNASARGSSALFRTKLGRERSASRARTQRGRGIEHPTKPPASSGEHRHGCECCNQCRRSCLNCAGRLRRHGRSGVSIGPTRAVCRERQSCKGREGWEDQGEGERVLVAGEHASGEARCSCTKNRSGRCGSCSAGRRANKQRQRNLYISIKGAPGGHDYLFVRLLAVCRSSPKASQNISRLPPVQRRQSLPRSRGILGRGVHFILGIQPRG